MDYAHTYVTLRHTDDGIGCNCRDWAENIVEISHRLGARLGSLKDLNKTFQTSLHNDFGGHQAIHDLFFHPTIPYNESGSRQGDWYDLSNTSAK